VSAAKSTDPERRRLQANSFGPAAALYDSVRPTYPEAALQWALAPLGPGRHRVADVGAGTGILTRVLAALDQAPIPVEPDPEMRARLCEMMPGVEALAGSAESLPFHDGGVDVAIAGQAYHWFDRVPAHAELARVIRPGGLFVAIWNDRDVSVPWLAEYSRVVAEDRGAQGSSGDTGRIMDASFGEHFGPTERAQFRHSTRCTADALVALTQSRSYYLTASRDRQVELVAAIRRLAASHPQLAGRADFELPYITEVYRGVRR
jgi:SAM-dependent methyltransferase